MKARKTKGSAHERAQRGWAGWVAGVKAQRSIVGMQECETRLAAEKAAALPSEYRVARVNGLFRSVAEAKERKELPRVEAKILGALPKSVADHIRANAWKAVHNPVIPIEMDAEVLLKQERNDRQQVGRFLLRMQQECGER